MSLGISAVGWAGIGTAAASLYAANEAGNAANDAAQLQAGAAQSGVDEQRRQFDAIQKLLQPYVQAGTGALTGQQDLVGLNGAPAQQQSIDALQQSPMFRALLKQGETSILQNASATGGLRGGNTQAALAEFSPNLLAQTINDQYARLGGLTQLGQNSAVMQGNAGLTTGSNIAQLLQQQGSALAGGALAGGKEAAAPLNSIMNGLGVFKGLGGKF